jgi:hypothetical protein
VCVVPPVTSTEPSTSRVAVCPSRAVISEPVATKPSSLGSETIRRGARRSIKAARNEDCAVVTQCRRMPGASLAHAAGRAEH